MLTSLALIFLVGIAAASIFSKIKLPRIIGMILTGIVLGPYVLDLLDSSILDISAELRKIALVIILIKAGLSLNLKELKKVGRPAALMSFLPATFEICAFVIFAPMIFGISYVEAAVMGSVLAAVSPAIVVPRMVDMMEKNSGTEKGIPQMILAGASLDDIFVIVLFTTFVSMAQGGTVDPISFLNIPVSIISGLVLGAAAGYVLTLIFDFSQKREHPVNNVLKVIIILGTALLLVGAEELLAEYISVSGLLAVVSMSIVIAFRSLPEVKKKLQDHYGKIWIAAEIVLFVLVGAAVDIRYTLEAGLGAILMIFIGLAIRSLGVWLCTVGTAFTIRERLFCCIAYLPKATVQAAIGGIPLAMGLSCGSIVLSVAVLGILITAPLGAIGIDWGRKHLLSENN